MSRIRGLVVLIALLALAPPLAPLSDPRQSATVRAAPSAPTGYAITVFNRLVAFDVQAPGALTLDVPVTGLQAGDSVNDMDFRPADAKLYVLTRNGAGVGRIYTVNTATGFATLVSTLDVALTGLSHGVDFNPVVDRLRVVSETGQNLRVNVDTGATIADSPINPAGNENTSAAYTNNFVGAVSTTLYGVDIANDRLLVQNPPNAGTVAVVGPFTQPYAIVGGFDVTPDGTAYAVLENARISRLYTVNLATGAETLVGLIGPQSLEITAFAVQVPPPPTPTPTATNTATATTTPTFVATATASATATATPTRTPTASPTTAATPTPVIPELPPLWLFATGLGALGWFARRRR